MRLIPNSGTTTVLDVLRNTSEPGGRIDIASPNATLFAFAELRTILAATKGARLILPIDSDHYLAFLGSAADRSARNRLQNRWLAHQFAEWLRTNVDLRPPSSPLPQATYLIRDSSNAVRCIVTGNCAFTSDGLGLTPGNQMGLIHCTDSTEEILPLSHWFESTWSALPASSSAKACLLAQLDAICTVHPPASVYYQVLFHLFNTSGNELNEDSIVRSATGIRDTNVWRMLFKFQRDGVIGAIEKLERFGGCIIADSVGLGKTFEALAIIKYYELRNDRVLVLTPKRLRDNWTLYKANDRRNVLAADRLNYDVLNHTDLSRDRGGSGDIDFPPCQHC